MTVTVTALSGTSPDTGASVSVNITVPNEKAAPFNGTTGGNGVASFSYKLSKHAAAGTYQAQASTATTGVSATMGASTTFVVQ